MGRSCSIPGVNFNFCRLRFLSKSESVLRNFLIIFAIAHFTVACLPNFSKNFVYSGRKTSFLNNFQHILPLLTALCKRKKWRCSNTSTHCRLIQLIQMAKTDSPLSCNSLTNSCTCSSVMSYQQNHYK